MEQSFSTIKRKPAFRQNHDSLLAEVSHDEAKMRERRETLSLSFLSFLPRRERPLLAGKNHDYCETIQKTVIC